MSEQLKPIKYDDVRPGYHFWAKKGDVWNNTRHLIKNGSHTTVCGLPLLGNNYSGSQEGTGKEVGCQNCLTIYNETNS